MATETYSTMARHYDEAVVAGNILTCGWVQRPCKRQLNDLAKFKATQCERVDNLFGPLNHLGNSGERTIGSRCYRTVICSQCCNWNKLIKRIVQKLLLCLLPAFTHLSQSVKMPLCQQDLLAKDTCSAYGRMFRTM